MGMTIGRKSRELLVVLLMTSASLGAAAALFGRTRDDAPPADNAPAAEVELPEAQEGSIGDAEAGETETGETEAGETDAGDAASDGPQSKAFPSDDSAGAKQGGGDDLFNLDLESLGNVEVKSRSADAQGAPSSLLDTSDFSAGDTATTGELLSSVASVTTRRTSALNLDPQVRGFNSQQIVAVANGMNQLKTRLDIDSLFSQIDPGIVDGVTVLDGPYSALYGPGFAFLVGDLYPARRFETPQGGGSSFFTYGTNGNTLYTRHNAWAGGSKWGFYASYGWRSGEPYDTGSADEFLVPASYEKWDGFLAFSYDLTPQTRVEFNYLRTEINHLELPGVVYDITHSRNDQVNFRYVWQVDPDGPENMVLQYWLHDTQYQGDASSRSKQDTFYREFMTNSTLAEDTAFDTVGRGLAHSMGARLLFAAGDNDGAKLTWGVDWRHYRQRYEEFNLNDAGDVIFGGNIYGVPDSYFDDYGAFAELTLRPVENLRVKIGGRLDYTKATVDNDDPVITDFTIPDDWWYAPGTHEPERLLGMAFITAEYALTPEWTINAAAARAMRAPTLAEYYNDEPYVPYARVGNSYIDGFSELQPEENTQFDLGATYTTERVRFGARGFYSAIHNYIMAVPAAIDPAPPAGVARNDLGRDFSSFPTDSRQDLLFGSENADQAQAGYQYVNLDSVALWGGDMFLEVLPRPWLSLSASTSFVYGENHSPVQFIYADTYVAKDGEISSLGGPEPLPGIYPWNGTLRARVFDYRDDRWSLEFNARLVASQDRVARSIAELPTPGFVVFGLRGYYRPTDYLRFTATIDNLLNTTYSQHGSLAIQNRQGRNVFLKEPGINVLLGMELEY